MSNCKLNCFVYGDEPGRIFEIKIAPTESVSALKELIKEKKKHAFRDVDADSLKLWKVDLPVDETLECSLQSLTLDPKQSLSPVAEILDVLDNPPKRGYLHIVVETPHAASSGRLHLKLNCFVYGDEPGRIFEIKIAPTESVSALKKVIKDEKKHAFRDVDADRLDLWKVNINLEKEQQIGLPHDAEELNRAFTRLSNIFTVAPENEYLHIVVKRPPQPSHSHLQPPSSALLNRTQKLRSEYCNNFPRKPPSSQGPREFGNLQKDPKTAVFWDRPPSAADSIPNTLLHPIFGTFMDDCENLQPTADDNNLVMALSMAMSGFFENETERASKFRQIMRQYAEIELSATTIDGTGYATDGDVEYKGVRYAIAEVKNEIGSTKAEPHFQAISYYIQATKFFAKDKAEFRFPCILISLFGSHIDFSAAVWTVRPSIQVISTALPLFPHQTDTEMRAMIARHVGALKNALRSLKKRYQLMESNTTSPSPDPNHEFLDSEKCPSPDPDLRFPDSRFPSARFPYPTSYTCVKTSSTRHFTYISQMDNTKLLFSAKTTDDKMLCIKFVRRYSREVHERCSSGGFAPALYGFENLPGKWHMIIMEMITDDYCCLIECSTPSSHREEIAAKLESLHQQSYVHGDIRNTNIMVKKDGSLGIKLVDFDWSGKIGEVRYPMNVYRGARLWRPDGAKDGQLIKAEHDIDMLHSLFA